MKKIVAAVVMILGLILAVSGIQWKMKGSASIAVIGGADGPTSIFVARKVGDGMTVGMMAIGVLLIVAGVVIYKMIKKK